MSQFRHGRTNSDSCADGAETVERLTAHFGNKLVECTLERVYLQSIYEANMLLMSDYTKISTV